MRGAGVNFDITRRKRAEEELRDALRDARQYASQLQELRHAGLMIGSETSLDEVLQETTEQAREIVGAHQAVTSLTIGEHWSQSITSVSLSEKYAVWRDYVERPDGSGIYSEVCRANRPMRLTQRELEAHPAFKGFGQASGKHPPMRGWLAAPLIGRGGENIGVVQLSDRYEGEFTETDEAILVQLAQMASVALENTRLYTESWEAESRYRSLLEGLDAVVWEAKAPDFVFSFVSNRAEDVLGYPPEKLLSEPGFLLGRVHPEDRRLARSFYKAAARGFESQEPVEYRVTSASGREVWLRDEARAIRDDEGNLVRLTGLMVDIT
ncbi:MAG: PAS domain-containing protein, partial [Rubrobacter sp.]|nr:PAS domain-containing protein [Rubrobacter sp.]